MYTCKRSWCNRIKRDSYTLHLCWWTKHDCYTVSFCWQNKFITKVTPWVNATGSRMTVTSPISVDATGSGRAVTPVVHVDVTGSTVMVIPVGSVDVTGSHTVSYSLCWWNRIKQESFRYLSLFCCSRITSPCWCNRTTYIVATPLVFVEVTGSHLPADITWLHT